jgi:hypothetical protein
MEAEDEMITSQASLPEPQKNSKSVPKIPNEKSLKQKVNHENKHSRDNSLPILRENQELEKPFKKIIEGIEEVRKIQDKYWSH